MEKTRKFIANFLRKIASKIDVSPTFSASGTWYKHIFPEAVEVKSFKICEGSGLVYNSGGGGGGQTTTYTGSGGGGGKEK